MAPPRPEQCPRPSSGGKWRGRAGGGRVWIAGLTLSWPRLTWPTLALRHAAPWRWKISATSSRGRDTRRASGGRFGALFELARNAIERAHDLADGLGGDAGIERRGVEPGVPQQDLDHPNVGVLLQQMRRKAVTKRVRGHPLVDLGHVGRGMAGARELASRHRVDRVHSGKQPPLWACRLVPGTQQLKQMRRQHYVAVFLALALFDPDHHPTPSPCRIPSLRPPRTRAIRPHRPHSMPPCI